MNNFKVDLIGFDELSANEKESVTNNGNGKEWANYIKVIHNGEVIFIKSDAMEPEDASFGRDLKWIVGALKKCYELGKLDVERRANRARP